MLIACVLLEVQFLPGHRPSCSTRFQLASIASTIYSILFCYYVLLSLLELFEVMLSINGFARILQLIRTHSPLFGLDKLFRPLIKVFYSCILRLLVIGPNENERMDVYEDGSLAQDAIETARLRDADAIYVHRQ